ncbi:hypothetical protein [Paraglaciecola sp.]|uniref:hypothetical protein n=1 Tax=Paraglaciecola sp. TaxID=1920173 RepID=UPI003EF1B2F4
MLFVLGSLVFSVLYYIQSHKTGLTAKKWAVAGLIFGPFIYPLFKSRQRVKLLKSRGFESVLFQV